MPRISHPAIHISADLDLNNSENKNTIAVKIIVNIIPNAESNIPSTKNLPSLENGLSDRAVRQAMTIMPN